VDKARILILSASFGDGHNTAARHLAQALSRRNTVRIADPCDLGSPRTNRFLCKIYREVTTYTPWLWALVYRSTDRQDFTKPLPLLNPTEDALGTLLDEFLPDLIVCTYPIYPYILERLFESRKKVPIVTVITDSIEINTAWTRSPSDHLLVTDNHTCESLVTQKIAPEKITITGFPVSTRFGELPKLTSDANISPFKVLYFPTSRSPHVRKIMRSVLEHDTHITVVLGHNVRRLYRKAHEIKQEYPHRVTLKGWTKKVPDLLCSHHLVVGKAGGATVHEALAAQCPMLVHHIVPGQEEGNIELLERLEVGQPATDPQKISDAIGRLLGDKGALWRQQKANLLAHAIPDSAANAAKFIESKLPDP